VVLILLDCSYDSPKLDAQRKILLRFIDQPTEEYFRRRSKQVIAFKRLLLIARQGGRLSRPKIGSGMFALLLSS
jgi:hypothetical protein